MNNNPNKINNIIKMNATNNIEFKCLLLSLLL